MSKKWRKFLALAAIALHAANPGQTRAEVPLDRCQAAYDSHLHLLSEKEIQDLRKFIRFEIQEERLWQSPEFRRFAGDRAAWNRLPYAERSKRIENYLGHQFHELSGRPLEELQSREITDSLRRHGVNSNQPEQGYDLLKAVSRENRDRIAPTPVTMPPALRDSGEAIDELTLGFLHNTNKAYYVREKPAIPLLSSKQLERTGIMDGLNSQLSYNREFLRSDNHVYFFVGLQKRGHSVKSTGSQYGENDIYLDPAYARRYGMAAAYNMGESDMARALASAPDSQTRILARELQASHGPPEQIRTPQDQQEMKRWETARNQLQQFDFTADDYEYVLKNALKQALIDNYSKPSALSSLWGTVRRAVGGGPRSDLPSYERAVEILRGDDPKALQLLIHRLLDNHSRLPSSYEFRVPVAVPHTEVRF